MLIYKHSGISAGLMGKKLWYVQNTEYIHTHIYILSKCNIVRTCSEFVKMTSHQDDTSRWCSFHSHGHCASALLRACVWEASSSCVHGVYERLRIQCAEKSKRIEQLEAWAVSPEMKQPASSCNPFRKHWPHIQYTVYYILYIYILYRYMHIHIIYKHTYSEGWRLAHPTFCEDEETILWSSRQLHLPRWSRNLWSFRTSPPSRPNSWDFIINRPYIQSFNGLHICQPVLHPVWDS